MLRHKRKQYSVFNDGMLYICNQNTTASSFGAVRNPNTDSDLTELFKLAYEEMTRRDEDLDFAENQGRQLSLKVKCYAKFEVTKSHLVKIGNVLYSIIKTDVDRNHNFMYLYLEEVRRLIDNAGTE